MSPVTSNFFSKWLAALTVDRLRRTSCGLLADSAATAHSATTNSRVRVVDETQASLAILTSAPRFRMREKRVGDANCPEQVRPDDRRPGARSALQDGSIRSRPALLTTTDAGPCSASTTRAASTVDVSSVTSNATTDADPPVAVMLSRVSASAYGTRPMTITAYPAAARSCAIAHPIPRPAPVTTATLSSPHGLVLNQ
jgi:hypothetical protein